jgi:ankyrin repeat protein
MDSHHKQSFSTTSNVRTRPCTAKANLLPSPRVLISLLGIYTVLSATGCCVPTTSPQDRSDFFKSVEKGEVHKVRDLLSSHKEFANAIDRDGFTALYVAADKGHVQVMQLLVDAGADVDAKSKHDMTALHGSAIGGTDGAADFLLNHKANPNSVDTQGDTPLNVSAAYGREHIVQSLLAKGADPNQLGKGGMSALHQVATCSRPEVAGRICKLLLSHGADLHVMEESGCSPLHLAVIFHNLEVVRVLLDKGADISTPYFKGRFTPLHLAATYGDMPMVKLLLSKGADPTAKNAYGRTPSQVAKSQGHPDVAQLIDEAAATKDKSGDGEKAP